MAELVDAPDLGSGGFICAGSSPVLGIFFSLEQRAKSLELSIHRIGMSSRNDFHIILFFVFFVIFVVRNLIQKLPRIQNPIRIQSFFDGPMKIKRGLTQRLFDPALFR